MTDWKAIGKAKQEKYEQKINQWNNTVMHYREGRLAFTGLVEITTDDWGVKVILTSNDYEKPITLSGAWEIVSVYEDGISTAYVNWSLTTVE